MPTDDLLHTAAGGAVISVAAGIAMGRWPSADVAGMVMVVVEINEDASIEKKGTRSSRIYGTEVQQCHCGEVCDKDT